MKKLLPIIICVFALGFFGCKTEIDHPIAGKHFLHNDSNSTWGNTVCSYYFNSNGTCTKYFRLSGYTEAYGHLDWEVDGKKVTVRYDHSTEWKASARGQVYEVLFYDAAQNTLTSTSGELYYTH